MEHAKQESRSYALQVQETKTPKMSLGCEGGLQAGEDLEPRSWDPRVSNKGLFKGVCLGPE